MYSNECLSKIAYDYRNFPDYYYNLSFPIPGGKKVDVIMLDTILLCGNTGHDEAHDQPTKPTDLRGVRRAEDQWAWLEQQLKTST